MATRSHITVAVTSIHSGTGTDLLRSIRANLDRMVERWASSQGSSTLLLVFLKAIVVLL